MRRHLYLDELRRIHDRVETLLADAVSVGAEVATVDLGTDSDGLGAHAGWSPAIDLSETPDAFHLAAELPGMAHEAIGLEVDGRRVTLAGERRPAVEGASFLRMERQAGAFRRVFELSVAIDEAGVETHYERGVLRARLPKLPALNPGKES